MATTEEKSVRRFAGNGDVLCDFNCPFNKIVDDATGFCLLYRRRLSYVDTGNNEICDRCQECRRE